MRTLIYPNAKSPGLEHAVEEAAAVLERGEVVALPTETVYGLGGNALNAAAAARIFEAKERPFFDPLICHLPDEEWLGRLTRIPAGCVRMVEALAERFWPGPLTLVLPRRGEVVPDLVCSGLATVAVRRSAHPIFAAILKRFGRPVAAPSANRFGRISPTCAEHVMSELGGRIPLIVDGGPTRHGVESTIVEVCVESGDLRVLRSGPVTAEELGEFGRVIGVARDEERVEEKPEAPGMLKSHYAPGTPMELVDAGVCLDELAGPRVGLLAWREGRAGFGAVEVLSASGDLREAAAGLFAKMRRLDEVGLDRIVAERVPLEGIGAAINDRLGKASYPRG